MIVTPSPEPAAHPPTVSGWVGLARRGMLWSEVQVFDVAYISPAAEGPFLDPGCLEFLLCARGTVVLHEPDQAETTLLAGQAVVVPPRPEPVRSVAGPGGAVLIRLRALPSGVSVMLPPRWPGLQRPKSLPTTQESAT